MASSGISIEVWISPMMSSTTPGNALMKGELIKSGMTKWFFVAKIEPLHEAQRRQTPNYRNHMMTIEMGVSTKYEAADIGIIAMDIYFPPYFVEQSELEEFNGVSSGKYTIGLEQEKMALCPENEDAISMALNGIELCNYLIITRGL